MANSPNSTAPVDTAPTATTLERAAEDHQHFYLQVRRALRMGHPLYHVRDRSGLTLDMCLTTQDATKVRAKSPFPRNVYIYQLTGNIAQRILL